ncbi:MAG: hypothetical protein OER90_12505, partial [Gemmatimonadota bacterium]|nr:hypothetical protein [Gemmatimonadota bacterium]
MDDLFPGSLNCTANDVGIAQVFNVNILDDGCAFPGDLVTLSFSGEVETTANERYDVGFYFAKDSGDALTGECHIEVIPFSGTFDADSFCVGFEDPFTCCTAAGTGTCSGSFTDLDANCKSGDCDADGSVTCSTTGPLDPDCIGIDTCGDISKAAGFPNPEFADFGPLTLVCEDSDGNGFLDVNTCASWRVSATDLCMSPLDAFPSAPSKCNCGDGPLEIP